MQRLRQLRQPGDGRSALEAQVTRGTSATTCGHRRCRRERVAPRVGPLAASCAATCVAAPATPASRLPWRSWAANTAHLNRAAALP